MVRVNALKLGVIVLLMASAAGCSASTPEIEGPSKDGGSYESPDDIADALTDAGLECSGLREAPLSNDAVQTQTCTSGDEPLTLRVFSDPTDLDAEIEAFDAGEEGMLVGENWSLVGPSAYVEDAHAKLGGEIDS